MIKTVVARRYAQALFELVDPVTVEATRGSLDGLAEALKVSAPLRHVVASPAFGVEEKISVLTELGERLGCPPTVKAFIGQLVKKNRVKSLPDIAEAFSKLVDQSKRTEKIFVSSAIALSPADQDRIKVRLRDTLGRDVDVTFETDPGHLAGLQIRIGSTVVDSTVRGRLRAMQSLLTKE